ncbi:MAG: flagellin, partial [Alphaproteobacteria bacterium]
NDTEFAGTKLVDGEINYTAAATTLDQQQGVLSISFKGNHDLTATGDSTASVTYATTGAFSLELDGVTYAGSIAADAVAADGTTMVSGDVISLTSTGTDNSIDVAIGLSFDFDTAIAANVLTLSGSAESSFTYKVGTGVSAAADEITASIASISAITLGISATDILTTTTADTASLAISNAIDDIQTYRAEVGANQNRLEFASANIATTVENTEAARSALLDLDVAQEMSNFTSKQILVQAGVAMLSQANQLPQNLLRLLQ